MSSDILSAGGTSPSARRWADAVRAGKPAVAGGVAAPAQPFLAAWLAGEIRRPLCVVCPDVKRQEEFFSDLLFWEPRSLLVPDLELASGGVVSADPELAAARLAALRELDTTSPRLVVVTAGGLTHPRHRRSSSGAAFSR